MLRRRSRRSDWSCSAKDEDPILGLRHVAGASPARSVLHNRRLWCWPPGQDARWVAHRGRGRRLAPGAGLSGAASTSAGASKKRRSRPWRTCWFHATVKVVSTHDVADALSCDADEDAIALCGRCDPSSKRTRPRRRVAAARAVWCGRRARRLVARRVRFSLVGLVKVVVCGDDRVSSAACVVSGPIKIDRAAYAALAEGTECDIVQF